MKRENLRRVKCKYFADRVKSGYAKEAFGEQVDKFDVILKENEGYFHEWNGGRAIIELEDGTIIQTPYWFVQFIS